jgi:predicted dehydrogenase
MNKTDFQAPSAISWGIIGCGDVTEIKSGPAFHKVAHSRLLAVMRRNAAKAEDYARRNNVPQWYSDAKELLNNPEINAVYVATPPKFHEEYVIAALEKGKFVYVEKPVTVSVASCERMIAAAARYGGKLCVAHYRRAQPMFLAIKDALERIGRVKMVDLTMFQPDNSGLIAKTETNWRVVPEISGGGLFFDLAPHQLDILIFLLGDPVRYAGGPAYQTHFYEAEDAVAGTIEFPEQALFTGNWCFTVPGFLTEDLCRIIGDKGSIEFPFFGNQFSVTSEEKKETFPFQRLEHVQQPMIQKVVDYFMGKGDNPCSAEEALKSMAVMEAFVQKASY